MEKPLEEHHHDHHHDHHHHHDYHDNPGHSHVHDAGHAMNTDAGLRAVAVATVGMLVVAAIEFVFFALSNSAGLLSDALHNLGDVLTTIALFIAFQLARRLPTQRYTYGYSRAEDLAGAFIALVIVGSAIAAAWESWRHLVEHTVPTQLGWGIAAALVGFVGNEALAQYKISTGRRIGSAALMADGQHSRTDGITSLAAAVGLLLVSLGIPLADPVAGLLISVAILYILVDVGRGVLHRLMDGVEPNILAQIRRYAATTEGVRHVDEVRARWAGRRLFVAIVLSADAQLTLAQAHDVAERVRQEILAHIEGASIVDVHVDPDGLAAGEDPHRWQHDLSIVHELE